MQHLDTFFASRKSEYQLIDIHRKDDLSLLAELINAELSQEFQSNVMFICTHNSRRSQLAEFLFRLSLQYFEIENVQVYSGGTEATAFNERMIRALRNEGFEFSELENDENPIYISDLEGMGQRMFSKVYNDEFNPSKDFLAIMVCDHADENCPLVIGASHRIALPFLDPKEFDGTSNEEKAYSDKVKEIGREMVFLAEKIKTMG